MKKLIAIILTLALMATMVACGQKQDTPVQGQDENGANNPHSVQAIKDKGVLSVATESQYAPFCFKDTQGNIVGLEPEFMKAFAQHLGVELDLQDMEFTAVVPSVQAGLVDLGIAGLTPDAERRLAVDFSEFYYTGGQLLVIKKDMADLYTTKESLSGKLIGAQKGTTQQKIGEAQFPQSSLSLLTKIPPLVLELQIGSIDALLLDKVTAEQYVKLNEDLVIAQGIEIEVDPNENGSAVALMKGNEDLANALNEFIQLKTEDGSIAQWYYDASQLSEQLAVE